MKRKSGIAIVFSLLFFCAFIAIAKNNYIQREDDINGGGLIGKYRVAVDKQGPLTASCSTAVYRGSIWHLSASADISNTDPNVEGSYEVTAKVLLGASFVNQYEGTHSDGRGEYVSAGGIIPEPTIDDAEAYAVITGGGHPDAEADIPW